MTQPLQNRADKPLLHRLIDLGTHADFQRLVEFLQREQGAEHRALLAADAAGIMRAQGRCQMLDELLVLVTQQRKLHDSTKQRQEYTRDQGTF